MALNMGFCVARSHQKISKQYEEDSKRLVAERKRASDQVGMITIIDFPLDA